MKKLYLMLFAVIFVSACATTNGNPYNSGCSSSPQSAESFFEYKSNLLNKEEFFNGAISCSNIESVQYIVNNDIVNINGNNGGGTIPIAYASARSKKNILQYIINHKSFDSQLNDQVSKALHGSIYADYEIIDLLISAGADVNYSYKGETVIVKHILYGNFENAKYLIEKGAKIDKSNKTLVADVLTQSNEETAMYLIRQGLPYLIPKKNGWTPFDIALKSNMHAAVELILEKLPNDKNKLSMINEGLTTQFIDAKMKVLLQTNKEVALSKLK